MPNVFGAGALTPEIGLLNYLINGGMDFAQRTGGAVTSIEDAEFSGDRWKTFSENDHGNFIRL